MTRNRIIALSSILLVASGGIMFACSGDDSGTDGGTDAKADQTSNKDSGADAGKDGSPFADSGQDATVQDSGNDATVQDSGTDATESDAETDAGTDAADDGSISDASLDGGMATTFMVLRVGGDGDAGADAALSGSSTQAYLEQRNISDGSLVQIIALPVTVNGSNQPCTLSGNSTSEGALSLSADGHYVVLAGYGTGPGTASVAGTATDAGVMRIVARVDKSGTIDTTTELFAYSGKNPRGATSNDGTSFWVSGTGNANEGPQYALLGSTGTSTTLATAPVNLRVVQIFGGQVYVSSSTGTFHGVSTIGTGMPTASGQTITALPGMPEAGSAYGFSMLDDDASVNGLDVMYIADDGSSGSTPGIQKWVFDGNTWTKIATFTNGSSGAFRGVTAYIDGSDIVVLATDTSSPTNVVKYIDDGQNANPTGTVLATSPTNTAYRGIALSPQ